MKLQPRNVNCEYINSSDDYTICMIMGSCSLIYGDPRKKTCKGIAFDNPEIMFQVAFNMQFIATAWQQKLEEERKGSAGR